MINRETYENLISNINTLLSDPNSYVGLEPTVEHNLDRAQEQLLKYAIPICGVLHCERLCLYCSKPIDLTEKNVSCGNASNNMRKKYCDDMCGSKYRESLKKRGRLWLKYC